MRWRAARNLESRSSNLEGLIGGQVFVILTSSFEILASRAHTHTRPDREYGDWDRKGEWLENRAIDWFLAWLPEKFGISAEGTRWKETYCERRLRDYGNR